MERYYIPDPGLRASKRRRKFLDLSWWLVYYCAAYKAMRTAQIMISETGGCTVVKVNQEELAAKIAKLKAKAKEKTAKSAGKRGDPEARTAVKKVKRAQRKLNVAKKYKTGGKKAKKVAAPAAS